jgi:hypothetical protein
LVRPQLRNPRYEIITLTCSLIAVVIGCGPGLYREIKVVSSTRHEYYRGDYNAGPYVKNASGRSHPNTHDDIKLQSYPRATTHIVNESSSQEELVDAARGDKIMVTRSVVVSADMTDGRKV